MMWYPDKPGSTIPLASLEAWPAGDYFAQIKVDGYRLTIRYAPPKLQLRTYRAACPVSDALRRRLALDVGACFPTGCVLDAEYCGLRSYAREQIWLFDVLEVGGEQFYDVPALERFERLRLCWRGVSAAVVPYSLTSFGGLVEAYRGAKGVEGVVLKARGGRYIASPIKPALNPGWVRCRW